MGITISQIKDPKIRAKAEKYHQETYENSERNRRKLKMKSQEIDPDPELMSAFVFNRTEEGHSFWSLVNSGNEYLKNVKPKSKKNEF